MVRTKWAVREGVTDNPEKTSFPKLTAQEQQEGQPGELLGEVLVLVNLPASSPRGLTLHTMGREG